jgi:PBP1b-binding outer membrane lipoprotein LpoB
MKGDRMVQPMTQVTGKRFTGGFIKQSIAIAVTMGLMFAGCSSSPPKAKVQNNASNNANVQFKPANGSAINIDSVAPHTTSPASEISKGSITVISDVTTAKDTDAITAATGKLYTAVIDSTGKLTVDGK